MPFFKTRYVIEVLHDREIPEGWGVLDVLGCESFLYRVQSEDTSEINGDEEDEAGRYEEGDEEDDGILDPADIGPEPEPESD